MCTKHFLGEKETEVTKRETKTETETTETKAETEAKITETGRGRDKETQGILLNMQFKLEKKLQPTACVL